MSDKLKNSKKPKVAAEALDRPFDPRILASAREIAGRYKIIIWFEDGEFYGNGLEMPMVMADGKTAEECISHVREALTGGVAHMLELGQVPPSPTDEEKRNVQVNVRLTIHEKQAIEASAKRKGFEGMGDFIRTTVLASLL